MGASDSHQQT